jgi:two-component system OmpR family sensor kinase
MRVHAPRSLRARLLTATLALAALGLGVAGVSTYRFLESFLLARVDQQLAATAHPGGAVDQVLDGRGGGPVVSGVQPGTYGAFVDARGHLIARPVEFVGYSRQRMAGPALPEGWPGTWSEDAAGGPQANQRFLTASSSDGTVTYRVVAEPLVDRSGSIVVAVPLSDVTATLHRLLLVEMVVALGVLAGLGALAWWLVRLGLRPLRAIGDTAGAIAAGNLSRRVEPADPATEVGRLGLSLNSMLGQIEESFERQRATEERLRQFVSDASHELRTPLTSIRGYAELFRRGAADRPEDLAKAMGRIEAEASRMGILVEDLLLLARLDEGVPFAHERVDLAAVAGRAVEDARAAGAGRRIELRLDGPADVEGDELRLKQILDNLLANARVHTPPGTSIAVDVGANGPSVRVDVTDRGPGVDPSIRTRIFERFYRADPARSRERGGAGLGLAIASELARTQGGTLALVPAERGARFRLTMPAAEAKREPAPESA